jgi:nucleotidyltransferase substrate binding protein (TIGR01987 family)
MAESWILDDFAEALGQFESALAQKADSDLLRAGCIQYFEFTFELAWKAIKVAADEVGLQGCGSPKSCLKIAYMQAWIDDEIVWLEMLEARNRMSHTYHAREALKVYDALPRFIAPMRGLLANLGQDPPRAEGIG